ncbi:response regulator [Pseudomonadota bacterium]
MIIGISLSFPLTDLTIELECSHVLADFKEAKFNATIEKIRPYASTLTGLIIPIALPNVDYSFRHFVEHIRIDSDENIAKVPIIIFAEDDQFLELFELKSAFREDLYRGIGVCVSYSPTAKEFISKIDPVAWEIYQKQAATKPHYDQGRHDQANTWGAFTAAESIHAAFPNQQSEKAVTHLRAVLAEDSFYKRKLQRGFNNPADSRHIVQLRRLQSKVANLLSGNGPILIVEDQLDDGWEEVYKALLPPAEISEEIHFAATEEEARDKFGSEYQLVLLDIRLAPDRDAQCQDESEQQIEELSGVRLAKVFREVCPTVPIVAATASNKSWTLEALLEKGIDAYWVKGAPEIVTTLDQGLLNLLDLFSKLDRTLIWSHRTRPWLENFYAVVELVSKYDFSNGERLKEKGKSLHALLSRAFSPFSNELSKGLQMNLAYLIAWSAMNDVVTSVFDVEEDESTAEAVWYLGTKSGKEAFVRKRKVTKRGQQTFEYVLCDGSERLKSESFPDTLVAKKILSNKGLVRESGRFWNHHREVRNGLPLIHGKAESSGASSQSVTLVSDHDIGELIDILKRLADAHAADLVAMKPTSNGS